MTEVYIDIPQEMEVIYLLIYPLVTINRSIN